MPDPGHAIWKILFIPAFGYDIEIVISRIKAVQATGITGISVKHLVVFVFVKYAYSRQFLVAVRGKLFFFIQIVTWPYFAV